jgi:hypothetical protein
LEEAKKFQLFLSPRFSEMKFQGSWREYERLKAFGTKQL